MKILFILGCISVSLLMIAVIAEMVSCLIEDFNKKYYKECVVTSIFILFEITMSIAAIVMLIIGYGIFFKIA